MGGNPEHCINLLQLVQEIASMLDGNQPDEDEEEQKQREDDEAHVIHKRRQQSDQKVISPDSKAKEAFGAPQPRSSAKQQTSNKRGRSYSDDKANKFNLDDIDISNEFDVNEDDDEEDQLMF